MVQAREAVRMTLKSKSVQVRVFLSPERQSAMEKLHFFRGVGKSELVELGLDLLFSRPAEEIVMIIQQRRGGGRCPGWTTERKSSSRRSG
jgi:hypothetical protein